VASFVDIENTRGLLGIAIINSSGTTTKAGNSAADNNNNRK
jgi:hypothetical protein